MCVNVYINIYILVYACVFFLPPDVMQKKGDVRHCMVTKIQRHVGYAVYARSVHFNP